MQLIDWQDCKGAFYVDGSLRDIYIQDTTASDWDVFLDAISSKTITTFVDGEPHPLPTQASEIFERNGDTFFLLEITLGQLKMNCHFFTEEEIELDIDPSEVTSQAELDAIIEVLALLGSTLGRDVILTDENMPTSIWIVFDAIKADVHFVAD
ncbi:hypothetical protein PhaeoP18_02313 [Phaeobacter piscinae]|uniref:Uncharacterized protein n=1 Tax=Phaeobacter piscinae TaxID=1580596 RepID=A0AAN1GSB0_9RHOB|nr:hypothetical protein [Phaeobacter piscinae]ATG44065.1 hypothetical protein PhaeoP13_02142 [Phaeobacter piscinae]AUR36569.1 hypothetical protein PhaeoP18_02313 [Phaeobacter piscinae]